MAPEQHVGTVADEKTDQFAFCLTVYEAVYGEPAFAGTTAAELRTATKKGDLRPAPEGSWVPSWLRRALVRGLAPNPKARWPSMIELIRALDRGNPVRRFAIGAAAVAAVAAMGVGGFMLATKDDDPAAACAVRPDAVADTWSETRSTRVREALIATEHPNAATTYERVAKALDTRTSAWLDMRQDACLANRVRGEQSDSLFDLRIACLDRNLAATDALTRVFADSATVGLVDKAVTAVDSLPELDTCADAQYLQSITPLPNDPEAREAVVGLRARIDEIEASYIAGVYGESAEEITKVVDQARTVGFAPVLGEALVLQGRLLRHLGKLDEAVSALEESAPLLAAAKQDEDAARAWIELISIKGHDLEEAEAALALVPPAKAAVARVGDDPAVMKDLVAAQVEIHFKAGSYDEALRLAQEALDLSIEAHGAEHMAAVKGRLRIGTVKVQAGDLKGGAELLGEVIVDLERLLGPDHPLLADAYHNRGGALLYMGDYEPALTSFEKSLAIRERSVGERSLIHAATVGAMGSAYYRMGNHEKALEYQERGLALEKEKYGEQHPSIADSLVSMANVVFEMKQPDRALELYQQAVDMYAATVGKKSHQYGMGLYSLAGMIAEYERYDEALDMNIEAHQVIDSALGSEHPLNAYILQSIAICHIELGRPARAIEPARRADKLARAGGLAPMLVSVGKFILARSLYDSGKNKREGMKLALESHAEMTTIGVAEAGGHLTDVTEWLEAHGGTKRP
jgi:tetratricopeptide (TPR) repeat protein